MRRPLVHASIFSIFLVGTIAFADESSVSQGSSKDPALSEHKLGVERYLDMEEVRDPQLSPDGSQILYTRRWVDRDDDDWASSLWIMKSDGSKNRFLVDGSDARWSPDGTRIVFLAKGEPEGNQVFVRWMDAEGATSQITRLHERPSNLRWSPDGASIAFTMQVPDEDTWKIDMPKPPKGVKWTEAPRIIESMHYRQDRRGYYADAFTHVFVVPADGGTPRQITKGRWNVGARPEGLAFAVGLDWTPDGRHLVFDGLRDENVDGRYRETHLYAVDVQSGDIRQITTTRGPWGNPRVSPDGKRIAFTGFEWTDQTYKADELYVIGFDGSGMRSLTPSLDRDAEEMQWTSGGLCFTAGDRGSRNVYEVSLQGRVRQLTQGTHILQLASVARNGVVAGVRSSPHAPPDVVTFSLAHPGRIAQLTHVNDDALQGVELGEVEEVWYGSSGDTKVQGWIVKPPGFAPTRQYPLVLHIHGGPHAMYGVAFNYSFQNLAANDYVVLYTNPRGSTGYGTDFGNAIDNDYPSVDYDDLMAGVDEMLQRGYVDADRMYVTGVSGGGVLSSWIIGHNDRFAAAAVRAPVINWMSFAGTTDIASWGYERFEPPFWDNPRPWLDHSPLMFVNRVKTPVLLMTGELDLRTPISQSEEYFAALKTLGGPAVMLRFNEEYHGTGSKPSNFMRTQLYLMSWFAKHTRASEGIQPASR
jgi:dipeptidyl aminopeptidase/acylaminoacyl peptidase